MTYEERKHWLCQQCGKQQCGYANRDLQDKCPAIQEKMEGWELGHADATEKAAIFVYHLTGHPNVHDINGKELVESFKKYMKQQ